MFLIIVGFVSLASGFSWWWMAQRARPGPSWMRGVVHTWMALQLCALAMLLIGRGWMPLPTWVMVPMFVWYLLGVPFALGVALLCGLWGMVRPSRETPSVDQTAIDDESVTTGPSRREVLGAAVALAPILFTGGVTGYSAFQMRQFRVSRVDVPLDGLPAALDGFRIAHVSDMHVGRFTYGKTLRQIIEATNDLKPDLVAFTGDLINHELSDLDPGIDTLEKMRGKYGVVAVEGNHDLFADAMAFESQMKASPHFRMLLNESEIVDVAGTPVQLLGARWGMAHYPRGLNLAANIPPTLALRDRAAFPILLAHHPHAWDYAQLQDVPLTLAGHTHGGQLMLSRHLGAGPMLFRYWSGLYGNRTSSMVVSNGVGNWFPMRVNAPAEIAEIVLHRA